MDEIRELDDRRGGGVEGEGMGRANNEFLRARDDAESGGRDGRTRSRFRLLLLLLSPPPRPRGEMLLRIDALR